jgi:hypothetical protein
VEASEKLFLTSIQFVAGRSLNLAAVSFVHADAVMESRLRLPIASLFSKS